MSPQPAINLKDLPRPPIEEELHSPVPLHDGPLDAWTSTGSRIEMKTRAYLDWLPTPRVVADVAGKLPDELHQEFLFQSAQASTHDPFITVGVPSIDEVSSPSTLGSQPSIGEDDASYTGTAELSSREIGRRGSRPDALTFNVINGPQLWRPVTIQAAGWMIRLEERSDARVLRTEAEGAGGYCTTHQGALRRIRGGRFTLTAGERVIEALSLFLTFLAGRWVGTSLPVASLAGEKVWRSWADPSLVDRHRGAFTWFDQTETKSALELFPRFLQLAADPDEHTVLRRAISFLVLANRGVPVDPGFSLAVSGLEFLGWHTQVTHGALSSTHWNRRMNARDRIEHLLNWAAVPSAVPQELKALQKAMPGKSGPECVVKFRNRFIHPRPNHARHRFEAYVEVWLLAGWYLELAILFWLGYTGRYKRRMAANRWTGATEPMPWA